MKHHYGGARVALLATLLAAAPLAAAAAVGASAQPAAVPAAGESAGAGKALYQAHCAACHEGQVPRAPHRLFLARLHASHVVAALGAGGLMAAQGAALSAGEHPHATLTGTPSLARGVLYVPFSSLELISAADAK